MASLISTLAKSFLSLMKINTVILGKNKGLKLRYNDEINLDMLLGLHEPNTFEVFDLFIKEGMTVVDIGANIGYFTKFLSKKTGNAGNIYAFEPIPDTFSKLEDTISLNQLRNVTVINKAVSNENSIVTMYLSHTHYMASLNSGWAGKEGGSIQVPSITLDSYFEQLGKYPDFIKMDIEGGGVFALSGMSTCIKMHEPVLMLESHTAAEDLAIGKALSLVPYDVYRVGSPIPVKYLDRDYTNEFGVYGTVIGIPKSKKHLYTKWDPSQFQKKRFGQRD